MRTSTGRSKRGKHGGGWRGVRTEDEDVENEDDEAEDATDAGGVGVEATAGGLDGGSVGDGGQQELEEDGSKVVHRDGCLCLMEGG